MLAKSSNTVPTFVQSARHVIKHIFYLRFLSLRRPMTRRALVVSPCRLDQPADVKMADLPLLKTITATFGAAVWFNAIVVLTHGQGLTLVHFSPQPEPFMSHVPVSPCLIDWEKIMHPTYSTKSAYVELSSGRVSRPCAQVLRAARRAERAANQLRDILRESQPRRAADDPPGGGRHAPHEPGGKD